MKSRNNIKSLTSDEEHFFSFGFGAIAGESLNMFEVVVAKKKLGILVLVMNDEVQKGDELS